MNYLFYLGIVIPTVITIVLFLVFIYCWFLQKARKEVLTKRYDPHGKMRRLGIPMDPPSPPPYCRVGSDLFSSDSGEDNEAYDVSRSPSTEQNIRGRPMYRTYHDSGISAGLSPTQEGDPRPGMVYRSCPDSGISGFGVQTMQTSAFVHHTCRGCCQEAGENIQMQQLQQQQQQQQQQQLQQNQQFQQIQQQQPQQSSSFAQQDQIPQQVILHHNTIQASVHPNHGVCYGDDTTHPQSPQHYNPPPFHPHAHAQVMEMTAMGGNNSNSFRQPSANVNVLPHIQELQQQQQPVSCVLQRTNTCCNHASPEHLNNISTQQQYQQQQQQLVSPQTTTQSCCPCPKQPQQEHYHQQQQQQMNHLENVTLSHLHPPQLCSSHPHHHSPEMNSPVDNVVVQARYINQDGGVPAIEPSAFKPKPIHNVQPKDSQHPATTPPNPRPSHQQQQAHISTPNQPPQPYPSTSHSHMHSYRDSGVVEIGQTLPTNTSPNDRPDSQASTSSTTDSEDSGFRSSHCAVQHNNTLNKHGNPLLKPLRRPKNHTKAKLSKYGNNNSHSKRASAKGTTSTPLTTLNPQNLSLSSHHEELENDVVKSSSLHDISENSVNSRVPPRVLHLNGQNNINMSPNHANGNRTILQLTPTKENDWSIISPQANDNDTKTKAKRQQQQQQQQPQQQQQQHFDMTDISTHLSWKYLQDMSAASSKSDGSSSSVDDSHRVVSPLLRHAPPTEPSMDVFSYSVV